MKTFPGLCRFYDDFFYTKDALSEAMTNEDEMLRTQFSEKTNKHFNLIIGTLDDLLASTNVRKDEAELYKSEMLTYCKAILVKISAFLSAPYVTTYLADQVSHVQKYR